MLLLHRNLVEGTLRVESRMMHAMFFRVVSHLTAVDSPERFNFSLVEGRMLLVFRIILFYKLSLFFPTAAAVFLSLHTSGGEYLKDGINWNRGKTATTRLKELHQKSLLINSTERRSHFYRVESLQQLFLITEYLASDLLRCRVTHE